MGALGSPAACPWRGGVQLQLLALHIISQPCFLLVFPCQGEPGRFGEPGDPGEDVSRMHMGGWGAGGGGSRCCRWVVPPPPSPSSWPGVFSGSQGVRWSQRGEGKCPLVPGEWGASPALWGRSGWLGAPGSPVPTSQGTHRVLCHHTGIARCRCAGTSRTGWASRLEGNPCPHVTLALAVSPTPRCCPGSASHGRSTLLVAVLLGPIFFLPAAG